MQTISLSLTTISSQKIVPLTGRRAMCLPYMNPFRTYRLVGLGYVLGPRSELKIAGRDRTSRIIDDHAPHCPKQLVNGLQHCCISHCPCHSRQVYVIRVINCQKKNHVSTSFSLDHWTYHVGSELFCTLMDVALVPYILLVNDAITLPCLSRMSLVPVGFQKVAIDTTVRARRRNDFWNGVLMPTTGELAPRNLKPRALNDHELSRKRS